MNVVSLSPSLTEILVALGRTPAGMTTQCFSTSPVIRVGEPKALDDTAIASLHPRLILADRRDNRPDELRKLEASFEVAIFDVRAPAEVPSVIRRVGELIGVPEQAAVLASGIEEEINRLSSRETLIQSVLLFWNMPYLTVNRHTYASRLVEAAGAANAFGQDPVPEIALDLDDFIDLPHDLLLLASDPYVFREKDRDFFRSFEAFSGREVRLIDGRWFSFYGPRTVEALRGLRQIIDECLQKKAVS